MTRFLLYMSILNLAHGDVGTLGVCSKLYADLRSAIQDVKFYLNDSYIGILSTISSEDVHRLL